MKNNFFKGHGLGNDYIALDPAKLSFKLTPKTIRALCDRNWGIGSDGILALVPSKKANFGLRIFNPDGSEAEKSGNGLRIFGCYLYHTKHTRKKHLTVETKGGLVESSPRVEWPWVGGGSYRGHGPCGFSTYCPALYPTRARIDSTACQGRRAIPSIYGSQRGQSTLRGLSKKGRNTGPVRNY